MAVSVRIEIAETPRARALGLMGRNLPDFSLGMLFLFDQTGVKDFWMRNTPTSLDMLFIGEDGRVATIAPWTEPMSEKTYSSRVPVRSVLEVRAGFAERFGIREGTRMRWRRES